MAKKSGLRAALLGCAAALGLCAGAAQAEDYTGFIVFGDSLADTGQFVDPAAALGRVAGTDGRLRFTNRVAGGGVGDPYSQQLSDALGFGRLAPSQPASFGAIAAPAPGLNYAVGGYRAANVLGSIVAPNGAVTPPLPLPSPPAPPGTVIPAVVNQAFLLGPNAGAAQGALALISAGGNDIRDVSTFAGGAVTARTDAQIDAAMATAAQAAADAAAALSNAGARLVIAPNLPDLGNIPETAELTRRAVAAGDPNAARIAAARSRASQQYNAELNRRLNAAGANVLQVDFEALFADVVANPARYGFAPISQSQLCFNSAAGIPCAEPPAGSGLGFSANPASFGAFLFNDGIHPTTAGAAIAAQQIAAMLQAPRTTSIAPLLGVGAARSLTDAVDNELAGLDPGETGFRPFAALGASVGEFDAAGRERRHDALYAHGAAGATYGFGDGLRLGAGLGYQHIGAETGDGAVSYDGAALFGLLLAAYDSGPLFASATAGYGAIAYDDIDRVTRVGGASLRNGGSADGTVYGVAAEGGMRVLEAGGVSAGPLVALDWWSSSVDGYTETGDAATALRFGDFDSESLRGGVGAFLETKGAAAGHPVFFRGEALYEHEFNDDPETVRAGAASQPGTLFSSPGRDPDDGGLRLGLQLGVGVGPARVSLGYGARLGDDAQHGGGLSVSVPF